MIGTGKRLYSVVRHFAGLGLLLLVTPVGAASHWQVIPAQSQLGFTAIQAGAAFDGRFETFQADIVFDGSDLEHSRFVVTVDIASVNTWSDERDEVLRSRDMFEASRWPRARFVAEHFTYMGGDSYVAHGELTIRDITRVLELPFSFSIQADTTILQGQVSLQRLVYGIGQGDLQDTTWVGNEVLVKFKLRLLKQETGNQSGANIKRAASEK